MTEKSTLRFNDFVGEQKITELYNIPGLAVSLVTCRGTSYTCKGVLHVDRPQQVNPNTIFEAASLTKPIVAVAALQLCSKGLMSLEASVQSYLHEPYLTNSSKASLITVSDALRHTTGFPNWREEGKALKCKVNPGERFGYSGEGYVFLQRAIESVSGQSLTDYVREHIFTLLNMQDSSLVWEDSFATKTAYFHNEERKAQTHRCFRQANAAYSLYSTAADYGKFLGWMLGFNNNNQVLIDTNLKQSMLTPQIKVNEQLSWGHGWGIDTSEDNRVFWQWGDNSGYKSLVVGDLCKGQGVVVFTNGYHGLPTCVGIVRKVLALNLVGIRIYLAELYEDDAFLKF